MRLERPWVNVFSAREPTEEKLQWLLRVGVLGCFVGHGLWGVVGKEAWLTLTSAILIPETLGVRLQPVVGTVDILVGIWAFLLPMRSVLAWAAFWCLFTAFLRPAAGLGVSELFERAGNFGVPLAFLCLHARPERLRDWFTPLRVPAPADPGRLRLVREVLTLSIASLLMGHGGLALFMQKALLVSHFGAIGVALTPEQLQVFGLFELGLGLLVLALARSIPLLAFVLVWKLATESLHPVAGRGLDILETIERMGDYVAPAAVIVLLLADRSTVAQERAATTEETSRSPRTVRP